MTIYEQLNRERKARAILDALDVYGHALGVDTIGKAAEVADALERQPDEHWRRLAVCAGQRPPSGKTKALVCERLRQRVLPDGRAVARLEACDGGGLR